jgi:dephospho-CoA kinase
MDVVLIGPIAAGKSTLGTLLSAALGLPQCSMDDVRFRYYREIGYRARYQQALHQASLELRAGDVHGVYGGPSPRGYVRRNRRSHSVR